MANCIILTGGVWNREEWSKIQRHLGPYRLSAALEEAEYTTFVLDYILHFTMEEIKQVLDMHLGEDTIWVGFSSTFFWQLYQKSSSGNEDVFKLKDMYWTEVEFIEEIITYIKTHSNAKIIYGGTKTEFFEGTDPNIDYYVIGMADACIADVTEYIKNGDESKLKHLQKTQKDDGSVFNTINAKHWPEPAMDNIRTPWWNSHYNVLPKEGLPMELARGCIFKCKFCTFPLLGKKKGTYIRDTAEIKDDMIRIWETYGTTDYFITDDTFNDDNDKIEDLHKAFTSLPFKPRFSTFTRMDLIHRFPHQADLLAEMGMIGTFFGIETLQADSAKSIGKGLHPNKVKDCLYWLADKWKDKCNMSGGFILGLPHDTLSYFEELLEWTLKPDCPLQHIQFYPLHLNDVSKKATVGTYVSEFGLNPEIYGYEFNNEKNSVAWELPQQDLSYTFCGEIAKQFNQQRYPKNKYAGYEMIKYLNAGVSLEDLYKLTLYEISAKYDMPQLNALKINQYKQLLGLKVNTG